MKTKQTNRAYQFTLGGGKVQVCPICGERVKRRPGRGRAPVFCGSACKQKAYRGRRRADREARVLEIAHQALWGRS